MHGKTLKSAISDTLPVMTGYLFLGFGFGIILQQNGYGVLWAMAMSLFIYAGSMQYVGVGLLTGGVSLVTAALTTLMVNARHLFYGISMIDAYQDAGKRKPYLIFALTDETYSLVCRKQTEREDWIGYCFLVSLLDQCYWVAGSVLGALAGKLPLDFTGIDFALTALFAVLLIDQIKKSKDMVPPLIGFAVTLAAVFLIPSDYVLLASLAAGVALLMLVRRPLPSSPATPRKDSTGDKT